MDPCVKMNGADATLSATGPGNVACVPLTVRLPATFASPPIYNAPATPRPPLNTKLPVVVLVDAVVELTIARPAKVAFCELSRVMAVVLLLRRYNPPVCEDRKTSVPDAKK